MRTPNKLSSLCMGITCAVIASATATADITQASGKAQPISRAQSIQQFQNGHLQTRVFTQNAGQISRVYGKAFSYGASSQASTQSFLAQNAGIWGVATNELIAEGPFKDGHHTQQIGYLPATDSYKFTGHYYKQVKDGVPVFRSKLVLLVRNEQNNPLVLASADLHDLSNYTVNNQISRLQTNEDQITVQAQAEFNADVQITKTSRMIFAGVDTAPHQPTLADISNITVDGFEKYLIVTDAQTGEILYQENLIHTIDISGNVSGFATTGIGTDECEPEAARPLPYLNVTANGISTFTDVNGNYTIANPGVTPITVEANLTGKWFEVFDAQSSGESESETVTPPGPADLLFNSDNNSETIRSQINAYIEANLARDFAIAANPSYPSLSNEMFPIVVNRTDGFCPSNAWYDPAEESINFCLSSGSAPNTAWSSVIHHEYGHHLVNAGGSGQGQYGEGMGDVISTIILDDPRLGQGFFGNCNSSLRNADNNHQYPCDGGIHDCGQLISGCVWDTRQELVITEPDDYTEILNFLAINSILVHSGSTITPQITIDWLTLDDDDDNIGNGTPHYTEIAAGFGAHNMDAPELSLVDISFPNSRPAMVNPNGTTTMAVDIESLTGTLDQTSPTLMVSTGNGFSATPLGQLSASQFEATFPTTDCGSDLKYYITAQTTGGETVTSPENAPASTFITANADVDPNPYYADNFQTNQGWTVSGNATDGQWNRGTPVGGGERGDPAIDSDGSGQCYLTDNVSGNSDVDSGSTILTSPVLSIAGASAISYARWYDNSVGAAPEADIFVVEISDNAGSSWTNLETVGPGGPEVSGGWITKEFSLQSIPGFTPNNQFRIRFTASDLSDGSVVEAGVDSVKLLSYICDACPADFTGDGILDFFDVSDFLDLFAEGDLAADFTDDGILDFFDVSDFLDAFSAGCP